MLEQVLYDKLIAECRDKKKHVFGTKYIFDKRAEYYGKRIRLLKLFGFLVPVSVGLTALGYGYNNRMLTTLIAFAIPLTILQFLISVFALFYEWDNELAYSYEASQAHNDIYERLKKLSELPPPTYEILRIEYDLLSNEIRSRDQQDTKHYAKEWELRKGYRFAMRQYSFPCMGCKEIPTSMESTDCPVCGRFKWYHKILNK